jgi:hypothetical protein
VGDELSTVVGGDVHGDSVSGEDILEIQLRDLFGRYVVHCWEELLRAVRIRMALFTRTGSESETESDTGDVSLGAGSTRKVEMRGEDPSLS